MPSYKVKLNEFEGPLDLLLFFIKRDELDIYDIPITNILNEFMIYLHLIKKLDLEIAGEFIIMACTLMQIKVRMLLPKEIDESGKEIDPREDLVQRLLEYLRYKELSGSLSKLEGLRRKISLRHYFENDEKKAPPDFEILLKNITLYDLARAFKKAIDAIPKVTVHEVKKLNVSTEEQMDYILNILATRNEIHFLEIIDGMVEKIRIIITFIVILELVKSQLIFINGGEDFNNFKIIRMEQ